MRCVCAGAVGGGGTFGSRPHPQKYESHACICICLVFLQGPLPTFADDSVLEAAFCGAREVEGNRPQRRCFGLHADASPRVTACIFCFLLFVCRWFARYAWDRDGEGGRRECTPLRTLLRALVPLDVVAHLLQARRRVLEILLGTLKKNGGHRMCTHCVERTQARKKSRCTLARGCIRLF